VTRPLFIEPRLSEDEALATIAALRASQQHLIALKIERELVSEREDRAARERSNAAEAERRAERAKNHVLTKRQAGCLHAVREGHGPWEYWETESYGSPHWRRSRSMGGASRRMVEALIEEGLLTEARALTPEGADRLAAWEAKHGKIGGEA